MRTLSAPLLLAQKSASGEPFVQVQVTERIASVRRLRWERLYTGSEPDGPHAAAMPADGSLIRARSTGGQLYYQRVPGPGSGSNYSTWTALGAVSASTGIALCSQGATVMLFYVDTDNQRGLRERAALPMPGRLQPGGGRQRKRRRPQAMDRPLRRWVRPDGRHLVVATGGDSGQQRLQRRVPGPVPR